MRDGELETTWSDFRAILAGKLGVSLEQVQREAYFVTDLGADSLDMIELLMELEDKYAIKIPEKDASSLVMVKDAFDYVVGRLQEPGK